MRRRNLNAGVIKDANIISTARGILKQVDVYPKLSRDFRVETVTGRKLSIVIVVLMALLLLSEVWDYTSIVAQQQMVVDPSIGEKLKINFNISFPGLSCKDAHISALDVAGDLQVNLDHEISKVRLDKHGRPIIGKKMTASIGLHPKPFPEDYCGSCYGANNDDDKSICCNTCDSVKTAYMQKGWSTSNIQLCEQCKREMSYPELASKPGEGCNLQGAMRVNKVAGNFHVALGTAIERDGKLIHQFSPDEIVEYNSSHIINSLSFGEMLPGMKNPLDGWRKMSKSGSRLYQYFIQIVPTIYNDGYAQVKSTQYSFTEMEREFGNNFGTIALPGAFFMYDLSPFMMRINTERVPLTHFLTRICAVVGGTFSVATVVNTFLHHIGRFNRE